MNKRIVMKKIFSFFTVLIVVVFGFFFSSDDVFAATSGVFTSQVIDVGSSSNFTTLTWTETTPAGTSISMRVRAGNTATPDETWIVWSSVANNGSLDAFDANRYIQYESTFSSDDGLIVPTLSDVTISYGAYPISQTLTSSPYNASDIGTVISNLSWSEDTTLEGTDVKFQVRTAPDSASSPDWANGSGWCGPTACAATTGDTDYATDYYQTTPAGENINSNQNAANSDAISDQWIQYKVWLISNGVNNPILTEVTMQYVVNATPVVSGITASQISDEISSNYGKIEIGYSISDLDEANEDDSITISVLADFGITLNEDLTFSDTTAISVSDASLLPTSGTIQIDNEQISYTAKSGNDLQGTIIRGANNTNITSHDGLSSGPIAIWIKGTSITGDIGVISGVNEISASKSIVWDINSDLDGIYYASAKIRVSANDGNGASQVGNGDSSVIELDTENPTLGTPALNINPNLSANNLFNISATDGTTLTSTGFIKFANASNIDGSTCSTDITSGTWESFVTEKTWTLSPDADRISTVCIQTRDKYNNESTVGFAVTPPKPSSMMIQDNSSIELSQYRIFVAWKNYTETPDVWANYTLQRSDDNETFSTLITLSADKTINYYTDNTTVFDQIYYYRVYTTDTDGSISQYSDTIQGNANGIQDYGEGGGGTAGDPPAIIQSFLKKTTSASQTSAKIFWSNDTTLTTFNRYEIWYGETLTDVQNKSGVALEWDSDNDALLSTETTTSTTITGLTESTTYYFKIWAVDEDLSSQVPTSISTASSTTATISFETDALSNSFVAFSTGTDFSNASEQGALTMITTDNPHSVTIIGLSENTTYYYRTRSANGSGTNGYLPLSGATTAEKEKYSFTTTTDITGPVVSSITSSSVTDSTATISWSTDEASTSRVDYGTSTSYGSNEVNANYNIDHSIILSNLTPETTYYFKVTSVDSSISSNSTTDDNSTNGYTFTTLPSSDSTPPTISSILIGTPTHNSVTITWTTNENSNSLLDFGTTTFYGTTQGNSSDSTTSHSETLVGLAPSTVYYFRVKSMDANGNTGKNTDVTNTFTTDDSPDPGDVTGPEISSISVSSITSISATISWTTDESSDSSVGFSLNTSYDQEQGSVTQTTSHSVTLTNLAPGTDYYYKVKSRDNAGNLSTDTNSGAYLTTGSGGDLLDPIISDVAISSITSSTAKVTWTTNENANSLVDYSKTSGVFTSTAGKYQDNTISHSIILTGLDPVTPYYLQIRSADGSGNTGRDSNGGTGYTFTTISGSDSISPEISAVSASTPTSNSVTITWTTNELSNSLVDFGITTSYGTTQGDSAISDTSHSVTLTGLAPATDYFYRVKSIDTTGNLSTDDNSTNGYTFTTAAGADPGDVTAPIITFDSGTDIGTPTSSSITITWTTDEDSDSIIGFSLDTSFSSEEGSATMATSHSVILNNLSQDTTYKFQIKSRDDNGNLATENNSLEGYTFTTLAGGDSTKPVISDVTVSSTTDTTATITWTTNENSNSLVDHGTVQGTYTSSGGNALDSVTSHSAIITGLTASTTYYFRVRSADTNSNEAADAGGTDGYTFTTAEEEEITCPTVSCGGGSSVSIDTNPPTISNIAVSEITASTAVVSWETNENGYSIVEHGIDESFGHLCGSNTESVKNHKVTLINLKLGALQTYRINSADSSGNLAQSDNLTFKTLSKDDLTDEEREVEEKIQEEAAIEIQEKIEELLDQGMDEETVRAIIAKATNPPAIDTQGPDITDITNSSARIFWKTDRKSNSVIRFKFKEEGINPDTSQSLRQYGSFTVLATDHEVILSGLFSGTTYQYQVQSSDILGNTGKSPWREFTTDVIPSIYDVIISDTTLNSVVVNWRTNVVSSSQIEYGKTIEYGLNQKDEDKTMVAKHILKLNNLQSGTTYHYRVRGVDSKGNAIVSDDYIFTTFTLPQIQIYTTEEVGETEALIKWETNVATDSTIKYTNLKDNVTKKQGEDALSTIHIFTLKSLIPGTKYSIQIQGRDIYANQVVTPEFEITTSQDTTSADITQVRTETAISSGKSDTVQTIISWKTNEPTTSQILWEEGISTGESSPANSTKEDLNYTTNHIVVITSFKPDSLYRFRVSGKDNSSNTSQSQDFTILIPEKKKSVIQIIIGNFENTFGWVKNLGS